MKILRYLMMAVLILGVSGIARAAGFQFTVLDPSQSDSPFFVVQPGQPFSFGFANCQVPLGGVTYIGCALGFNDSNQTITNLNFGFANNAALGGNPVSCTSDAFSDLSCGLSSDGASYSLTFEDGCGSSSCGIAPYHFIVLLENGAPGDSFPDVMGTANATPEPSSIWMALSGVGSLGYLVRRRRRAASR
jgi:uncharacterized protein (TIGR03382 family)